MALVLENRIDQILRERLRRHGVLDAVKSIELFAGPERVLADVVLLDASVQDKAEEALQGVERELEGEGVSLAVTTRALWEVDGVERALVTSPPGAPSDAVGALFKATVRSGARQQEVWVSMSPSAQQVLSPLAGKEEAWRDLVRAFLEHWLSTGASGYWDPMREQKLEIDEGAAGYLRWRPYEQLKGSVDLVFRSFERTKGLLQSFKELGEKASDFTRALPKLAGPRGAYARGERLPTSNYELYGMLLGTEKEELCRYYVIKLQQAGEDWPELKKEFPNVLAA